VELKEAISLNKLGCLISGMARKQEVVARLDHPGKTHEQERVDSQSTSHLARDQLGILLEVGDGGQRKSPVSN